MSNTIIYSFKDDYSEGAHPSILDALLRTNLTQLPGYGEDEISLRAIKRIKKLLKTECDIHFIAGGTQTNLVALQTMLRPYESIIAASTSHIATHETGAIEHTGHKIHEIAHNEGKIDICNIEKVLDKHFSEHMVKPKVVFLSQSTEYGTIYSKKELEEISSFCRKNDLYLYIDGARIASALTCEESDMRLEDIAKLCDMFYIGSTKNAAMFGEALVITNENFRENFRYILKQNGALLAKGRFLGIQFDKLFKDDLYFKLAKHANDMAKLLAKGIAQKGYTFFAKPQTNQLFPILPNSIIRNLQEKFDFYIWQKYDNDNSVIRLITSWATEEKNVNEFIISL